MGVRACCQQRCGPVNRVPPPPPPTPVLQGAADTLFALLHKYMRPHARIAYWCLLVPREPTRAIRHLFAADDSLAQEIYARDRVFFYSEFHLEVRLP